MITLEGTYYDGRTPVAMPARMEFEGHEATLIAGQISLRHAVTTLNVSPRIGKAERFISLSDNGQFQCSDHPILQSLPQTSRSEGPVAWMEERWGVALAGVAITACLLLAGYFYGLPAAAEHIATRIPVETEQKLGQHTITWLDEREWFKPTNLDLNTQKNIREGFESLRSDLPLKSYYQLEFRASKVFGANAFALPGGTIVITDDMVQLAISEEEVLAVLAHEIGHVELRHTMRSLLQNSAVAAAAAAVTSDAASLSVAVAGLPVLVAQTKYSREFEAAADEYAFKLLIQKGFSPEAFASLMERLAEKNGRGESAFAYISTHPFTEERIKRARDSAISGLKSVGLTSIKSSYEAANRRDINEGVQFYSKAIGSGELSAEKQAIIFNDRGNLWLKNKGYLNAIADYNEAIRLNPQFAMAFFNRGIAHFQLRQLTFAVADLKESQQLHADPYTSIWLYLAEANSGANDARLELAANTSSIKTDWPIPVVTLYLGKSNQVAVTAAVSSTDPKKHKEQMCEANFYLGEWDLIRGDKWHARESFLKAVNECPRDYLEYAGAVSELERLN